MNERGHVTKATTANIIYNEEGEVSQRVILRTEKYQVDVNGNKLAMVQFARDTDIQKIAEVYELNKSGQRVKAYIDNYGDGNIVTLNKDGTITTNRDSQGNVTGKFEGIEEYVLNPVGTIKTKITKISEITSQVHYTYHANNMLKTEQIGSQINSFEYEWSKEGRIVSVQRKTAGKDTHDSERTVKYDKLDQRYYEKFNGENLKSDKDDSDWIRTYTFDEYGRIKLESVQQNKNPPDVIRLAYNDYDQAKELLFDHNKNYSTTKAPDATDAIEYFTYDPIWMNSVKSIARTDHQGNPLYSLEYEYNDNAQTLFTFYNGAYSKYDTDPYDTIFGRIIIGRTFGEGAIDGLEADITQWSAEKKARFALQSIVLGNANADTTIVLDKSTLASLKGKEVRITGDNSGDGDKVKLKNAADFTNTGSKKTDEEGTFMKYTSNIDGQEYILWIDTDVKVEFI